MGITPLTAKLLIGIVTLLTLCLGDAIHFTSSEWKLLKFNVI